MAQTWPAKAPSEVVERRWSVPVDCDDGLASFGRSASGVTIDSYSTDGDDAVLILSAGVDGVPATVTLTAATSRGRVLVETFYLPIQVTTSALGNTARDVCLFALRKISGNGTEPDATELADALERLNDMLADWNAHGAAVGVSLPLEDNDQLLIPDDFLKAVKNNLILEIVDLYDNYNPSPRVVMNAARGLQRVKTALLPKDRAPAVYF